MLNALEAINVMACCHVHLPPGKFAFTAAAASPVLALIIEKFPAAQKAGYLECRMLQSGGSSRRHIARYTAADCCIRMTFASPIS